jgi:propanediol dehydratase small subunit
LPEPFGCRGSDAAGAAGHESDAALEAVVVGHRLFLYRFLVALDPKVDYPLGARRPDLIATPGGISFDQLELGDERIDATELRATPETLRLQAEVARASGRRQLADNLLRAAELAPLPDETILAIYTALRPRRSSAAELERWAAELERLHAPAVAAFVREAAEVYSRRGLLVS